MKLLLELLLLIIVANAIVLDKALATLSPKELKRRARIAGDPKARAIYGVAAYGGSLHMLLWLKGSLAAGLLFVMLAGRSWVLALIFILAAAWAVRVWRPASASDSWVWSWAAFTAPMVAKAMSYLQPLFGRLQTFLPKSEAAATAGVYEKEDLQEFLISQSRHPENRIAARDLEIAASALTFGDKNVGSVMTPLRKVRVVGEDEQAGPHLMDELHSSGFSRFPVTKEGKSETTPQITGTLYLKDLVGYTGQGKVRELMDKKVYFVNETQSLRSALDAFLKTHHHLFIVVNNFEEVVGVVTIEDVLEQIIGKEIVDEFDKYDDLRAVAAQDAEKEHSKHQATHPEELEADDEDQS
jgi:CBS domain containing-hemolysin-like protein